MGNTTVPDDISVPSTHATLAAIPGQDGSSFQNAAGQTQLVRSIWFGTGGNANLVDSAGNACIYKNIPDGSEIVGLFKGLQNTSSSGVADMVLRF